MLFVERQKQMKGGVMADFWHYKERCGKEDMVSGEKIWMGVGFALCLEMGK